MRQFNTKKQRIDTLQQGEGFDDGRRYTIAEYKAMADRFEANWIAKYYPQYQPSSQPSTSSHLSSSSSSSSSPQKTSNASNNVSKQELRELFAKDYWDMVETSIKKATVEYGNDIDTVAYRSGFSKPSNSNYTDQSSSSGEHKTEFDSDYYRHSGWNLNNIAAAQGSVLRCLSIPINGINVPWLYIGMLFASFCWHSEDNYLYSINYSHFGAPKQWYGVPGDKVDIFEKASKQFLTGLFRESPDLLHHMTTQIPPSRLKTFGVPVYKMTQEPKTFIITFPKAFHAGFSYGVSISGAVDLSSFSSSSSYCL